MIKFIKKSAKVEKLQQAYDTKPLPPEPAHMQRQDKYLLSYLSMQKYVPVPYKMMLLIMTFHLQ